MNSISKPVQALLCIATLSPIAFARSQELANIAKGLDAQRRRMATARAMADAVEVFTSPSAPFGRTNTQPSTTPNVSTYKTPVLKWAFSGEKRLRETYSGFASAFDGTNNRIRRVFPGGVEGPTSRPDISAKSPIQIYGDINPNRGETMTITPDPIDCGYKVNWVNANRPEEPLWLSQAMRRKTPELSSLPNGNVRLTWRFTESSLKRVVELELDPGRGYLIVKADNAYQILRPVRNTASVYWTRYRVRITESKKMDGWHLPIRTIREGLDAEGKTRASSESRLTNIRTDFSDRIFTDVFKPGDIVNSGSTHFLVLEDGSLKEFEPPSWDQQMAKQTQREYLVTVGSVCGVIIAIFVIANSVRRARLARHR